MTAAIGLDSAGKVNLVVGSQRIVPDRDAVLRRIHVYALPWENVQVRQAMNMDSFVGKILIVEREWADGQKTAILVRESVGM